MDRKEYRQRYHQEHKEERKLYLEANREKIRQQRKTYRERTKYNKWLYRQKPEQRFADYRYRAKNKEIDFEITLDEFVYMTSQPCYYCGDLPDIGFVGVDRINSAEGYYQNNCLPCCAMCNYMKKDYSRSDFINQIHRIVDNLSRGGVNSNVKDQRSTG